LAEIERAFAETWAFAGERLPQEKCRAGGPDNVGDVGLRVVATEPNGRPLPYGFARRCSGQALVVAVGCVFSRTSSYVQALRSAAKSGVDVRL
jgi:hypothetical protein